ncbi:MAG: hypothetical protein NXI10_12070 [bacterium]|nr:hypothetical protein [bacterium]
MHVNSSILLLFLLSLQTAFGQYSEDVLDAKARSIPISWGKHIQDDFSFRSNWSYPEGVYLNSYGQVSCDGFCPEEVSTMKDTTGRIYDDSLRAFYEIVDTTHNYHTLFARGALYEWAGSNYMNFTRNEDGTLKGVSECNAATHSRLNIIIAKDEVQAWVSYNGITERKTYVFPLKSGEFQLDKKLFKKGIVKATFYFEFENHLESLVPLNCEGMIYKKIDAQ